MAMTIDNRLRFNQGVMENLLGISQQHLDEGRPEEALRVLETLIEGRPEHDVALALRGAALTGLQRHAEAAQAYAEALKVSPRAEYYVERSKALRAAGSPAEALACLDIARLQLGELAVFEVEAVECERELKNYMAALERNLRLLRSPGPNEELLETRGDLYAEAGMDDEALAAWQQALKSLSTAEGDGAGFPAGMISRLKDKIRVLGGELGE